MSEDPSLAFRLAATAAELDRPIAKGSLHRLADRMPPPSDPWHPEVLGRAGAAPGRRPSRHRQDGVAGPARALVRIIPEWAAVRNKPQRNAYHTYTVDRHLLEAAALASELTDPVERPDLLLIGALLHDIGKGFPGDHTDVGMELVRRMATRMGFAADDVEILVDLVRHHLLLPDTATRRDLDDPTTIANVARAAGNRITLHLLGALTEADSRATGPSAWGTWKAGLVADLVRRADLELAGETQPTGPVPIPAPYRTLMEEVRPAGCPQSRWTRPRWSWPPRPARPALRRRRRAGPSRHGCACGQCERRGRRGRRGLHGRGRPRHLARHRPPPGGPGRRPGRASCPWRSGSPNAAGSTRRRRRSAAHVPGTDVRVDNDASDSATVLEVRAPDEVGLLHRITRALFEADLDLVSARVSTLGEMVVDAFYVRENIGAKVTDPDRLDQITAAIWDSVRA